MWSSACARHVSPWHEPASLDLTRRTDDAPARMLALLRAGGVLRLWDVAYNYDPVTAEEQIEAWCSTGGSTVEAEWSRAELEEHVRDEHSTYTWLLEARVQRAGFEIRAAEYSDGGIDAKYVLLARCSE